MMKSDEERVEEDDIKHVKSGKVKKGNFIKKREIKSNDGECGCSHEHKHSDKRACGHDHDRNEKTTHEHNREDCSCVHEHDNNQPCGHKHSDKDMCSGGHIEDINVSCTHEHLHDKDCSCGHEHELDISIECNCGHEHNHRNSYGQKNVNNEICNCGHEHNHSDSCGHDHGLDLSIDCGCGHDHGHSELDDKAIKKRRNIILLSRMAVTALLIIVGVLIEKLVSGNLGEYLSLAVNIVAFLVIGYDILWRMAKNIVKGKIFDENFLMTIAAIAAFVIGENMEAVLVIFLYQIGEAFQTYASDKSVESIKSIVAIRTDKANLWQNGEVIKVSAQSVGVGSTLVVMNGEKVPLDGIVIEGETYMDTLALTGESVPKRIENGSEVLAGYINTGGAIKLKVTRAYADTTAAKIIDTVGKITSKKSGSERFVTKFAKYYTPVVVVAAFLLAIIPSVITKDYNHWITTAINFLVISCPCALVISVPMTYFGGIGIASKQGILIKGGTYIDSLAKARKIVFDKTRTLTNGVFEVSEIKTLGESQDEMIEIAASIENFSTHPIAVAITKYNSGSPEKVENVKEVAGKGLTAIFDGIEVAAGNDKLMADYGITDLPEVKGTAVHIVKANEYLGYILISDHIKEGSAPAMAELKDLGLTPYMLTGDKWETAYNAGEKIGIDKENIYAELLPLDKTSRLEEIIEKGKNSSKIGAKQPKTVFVGDGINDAPVIALADVGVAMGGAGAEATIEVADIVVMNDEPMQVVKAVKISKRTKRIVLENIIFSLGVKLIIMVLSLLGYAYIWLAIFADVGVSILAVLNALRMLIKKK